MTRYDAERNRLQTELDDAIADYDAQAKDELRRAIRELDREESDHLRWLEEGDERSWR